MAHRQLPKAAANAAATASSTTSQRLKASKAFTSLDMKSVLTHIGVGMGAASFWRGAWYVLDDHLFPNDPLLSATTSFGLGCTGMTLSQGLVSRLDQFEKYFKQKSKQHLFVVGGSSSNGNGNGNNNSGSSSGGRISYYRKYVLPVKVARFGALYTIAISCVLVWRGTWLGWDVLYEMTHPMNNIINLQQTTSNNNNNNRRNEEEEETTEHHHHHHSHHHVGIGQLHAHHQQQQHQPTQLLQRINSTDPGHATTSGILSHVVAVTLLCTTGLFASVLAPPAATSVIRDFTIKASSIVATSSTKTTKTSMAASAFGTTTGTSSSYSGPAQKLVSQLFGGFGSTASTSSAVVVEAGSSSSSTSSSSGIPTPTTTASYHHNSRSTTTATASASLNNVNNSTNKSVVIAKSPYLRQKETPKMSRNHNPLGGNTATSIH